MRIHPTFAEIVGPQPPRLWRPYGAVTKNSRQNVPTPIPIQTSIVVRRSTSSAIVPKSVADFRVFEQVPIYIPFLAAAVVMGIVFFAPIFVFLTVPANFVRSSQVQLICWGD